MLREILFSATILTFLPNPISAEEFRPKGVRADFAYDFIPGKTLSVKQNIEEAVGAEKINLASALSLGHGGEIKVANTKGTKDLKYITCFNNITGPDFYIHEPFVSENKPESIEVSIGTLKNLKKTPWYSLGTKSILQGKRGYIPFDISKNNKNVKIKRAYWIRIRDVNSRMIDGAWAGFEMSAAIIKKPCNELISKVTSQDFL